MSWVVLLLISLVVLIVAFAARIPVALGLTIAAFVGLSVGSNVDLATNALKQVVVSANMSFLLVAVPLFILMAEILTIAGVSGRAFGAVKALFSGRRASVPVATMGLGAILSAVSGSSAANLASVGRVAMGEMADQKYPKPLAAGSAATAGGLGIIIPPSIPAILYAYINEMSVIAIFTAGIVPGLIIIVIATAMIHIWLKVNDPGRARTLAGVRRERAASGVVANNPREDSPTGSSTHETSSSPWRVRGSSLLTLTPLLLLVVVVLGTIYGGLATPTEAAAIGVVGALVVGATTGQLALRDLWRAVQASLISSGFILLILFAAVYFVFFLNFAGIPNAVIGLVLEWELGPVALLLMTSIIVIALGTLMDTMSLVLVTTPILGPVLVEGGFEPVVAAIILLLLIEIGLNTPPTGLNIFILLGISKQHGYTYRDIIVGLSIFLIPSFVAIAAVAVFPAVATFSGG